MSKYQMAEDSQRRGARRQGGGNKPRRLTALPYPVKDNLKTKGFDPKANRPIFPIMKTRESIERGGDIFTCVRDDTRGLEYTFTCEVEPVQAEGTVQGLPLYFRAKRDSYRFAISEDENVSPVRMTDGSSGFYVSVDLPDAGGMPLEEAEEIIERLTDQYLENRSR